MKHFLAKLAACAILFSLNLNAQNKKPIKALIDSNVVFQEKDGMVAVETEYYYQQTVSNFRQWYRASKNEQVNVGRYEDGKHIYDASNNAYLEILPGKHKEATISTSFNFESGNYDIVFVGVGENDGHSTFTLFINDTKIGSYQPEITKRIFVEGKPYNKTWENITLKKETK